MTPPCQSPNSFATGRHRGAVLVVVLVSVGVAAVVLVAILKWTASHQRSLQIEQWQAQALWLAESGLDRAAARLDANPAYAGERWLVPSSLLDSRFAARVEISVQAIPGQPARRSVRVVADYPDQPQDRARRTRQVVLDLSQGASQR